MHACVYVCKSWYVKFMYAHPNENYTEFLLLHAYVRTCVHAHLPCGYLSVCLDSITFKKAVEHILIKVNLLEYHK
jgi:hypothetical protein